VTAQVLKVPKDGYSKCFTFFISNTLRMRSTLSLRMAWQFQDKVCLLAQLGKKNWKKDLHAMHKEYCKDSMSSSVKIA